MRGHLNRHLIAIGVGIAGLAAITATVAAPASAATGIALTATKPTTATGAGVVHVSVVKTNPSAAAQNYTFSATVDGVPVQINATTGGTIDAYCGHRWKSTETRVNTADFFVVNSANVASRSFTGTAPTDPTVCNGSKAPTSPDVNANVKVNTATTVNVLASALDPDGDSSQITILGVESGTYGTTSIVTLASGRDAVRYVPNTGAVAGSQDRIGVFLKDADNASGVMYLNVTLVPSGGIG